MPFSARLCKAFPRPAQVRQKAAATFSRRRSFPLRRTQSRQQRRSQSRREQKAPQLPQRQPFAHPDRLLAQQNRGPQRAAVSVYSADNPFMHTNSGPHRLPAPGPLAFSHSRPAGTPPAGPSWPPAAPGPGTPPPAAQRFHRRILTPGRRRRGIFPAKTPETPGCRRGSPPGKSPACPPGPPRRPQK